MNNVLKKGSRRRLVFDLFLLVWFVKSTLGFIAVAGRDAPGYPGAVRGFPYPYLGGATFYVVIPAMFVGLNVIMFLFASRIPKWLAIIVAVLQFFNLLILLFLGAGGI